MSGEFYALLAAIANGVAGVAIVRGKASAKGDNGVFLSVLITLLISYILWMGWGTSSLDTIFAPENIGALAVFAAAGFFSTVLGRITLYRATEQIGAVSTIVLRRLTPVFALPLGFLLVGELPDLTTISGSLLVILAVIIYLAPDKYWFLEFRTNGFLLGIASAIFYAVAYTLRSLGLDTVPDAAFGAFIGALIGCLWFVLRAGISHSPAQRLKALCVDHNRWHMVTAISMSTGQILQFFALKTASVFSVTTIGTLEVFFSAVLGIWLTRTPINRASIFFAAGILSMAGTALMFW